MINNLPIHLLRGLRKLNTENLEKKLLEQENDFFVDGIWNKSSKENGLFFDLSQLRWVNLSAVNQLTLLIENAVKSDIKIYIALPLRRLTQNESQSKRFDETTRDGIRNSRVTVNKFLKLIQFDRVAKCTHIAKPDQVVVTEQFEFTDKKIDSNYKNFFYAIDNELVIEKASTDYSSYNYQYIFPMTWIKSDNVNVQLDEFDTKLQEILTNTERGLNNIDVLSLRNVIISELIKNVKEHAGSATEYGLLSIGLMPTKTLTGKFNDSISFSNNLESDYFKWLKENKIENFIEIYFGDSGNGIVTTQLQNAYFKHHERRVLSDSKSNKLKILNWAFDKWSTRKNETLRGTKGLYRINRIVNKYNGIFLLRTKELYGGYQKGGFSNSKWISNEKAKYFNQPGTIIQLKLCPYREVIKFNYTFQDNSINRRWFSVRYELKKSNLQDYTWIDDVRIIKNDYNVLLIIQVFESIEIEKIKNFLGSVLKRLSHIRHPNGIVVYFNENIGVDLLEEIAHSTDELMRKEGDREISSPDHEDVYDPVLLIENNNNIFWYGGDEKIIKILNEVYNFKVENPAINDLESFKALGEDDKGAVLMHFQNDNSLIKITKDNTIEFNFRNLHYFFIEQLKNHINNNTETLSHTICSPKLKAISEWYDVKEILNSNEVVGYALGLYLKFKEEFPEYLVTKSSHILIDHNQQRELAEEFAKLCGIKRQNIISLIDDIDFHIPRRTTLFDKDDDVIIITTLISSSETIRRLIKYAKRDMAKPLCILSLINKREVDINLLNTWGETTPIITLYQEYFPPINTEKTTVLLQDHFSNGNNLKLCEKFISPDYDVEEKHNIEQLIPDNLREHIINTKALFYNHIGTVNGRHFTFYLNKKNLLERKSFIWTDFLQKISKWIMSSNLTNVVLIKPEFTKDNNDVWNNCINFLKDNLKSINVENWNVDKPQNLTKHKNIVYIDFGALTGKSINTFLSSIESAENVFMCILFSQFQNNEINFYKKIKDIEVYKDLQYSVNALSLFEEIVGDPIREVSNAKVKIEFLYNLPIDFYNSSTCPICEHERALENYKISNQYMVEFANDRKERLKIREKKSVGSIPLDFYGNEENNFSELSMNVVVKMYEFKLLLEKAQSNTQYRVEVYCYVAKILFNINEYIKDPESDLYSLLYFISNEVIWLQKEPMLFRDIRDMISEAAKKVACITIDEMLIYLYEKESSERYNIQLAIRYKYAAITVLRSSHKLRFCESIYEIINSSSYKGVYSNNLLQNTFYHISSLHQNKYNKSLGYFNKLQEAFKKILVENLSLSSMQYLMLMKLKAENEHIRKSLEIGDLTDIKIIKALREEFFKEYHKISHPTPAKHFENLDFRTLGYNKVPWEDFRSLKQDSDFYEDYEDKKNMLNDNWIFSNEFLETKIQPYLLKLSEEILNSEIFSIFLEQYKDYENKKNQFAFYLNEVTKDILNLIPKYDDYHIYYDYLYSLFFKYAKDGEPDDVNSKLLFLLSSIPTNLIDAIKKNFHLSEFKDVEISPNCETFEIFYSKAQLNYYLGHIKNNILQKIDKELESKDITIKFNITKDSDYIYLIIRYDGTNEYKFKNTKGGLFQFENDLKRFGGEIEHKKKDGDYTIILKFINYDKN